MANFVFPSAKKAMMDGDLALDTATIKCVLIDQADDTPTTADDFLNDIAAAARVGTPQTLGTKTTTGGVFDAADVTFPSVTGDVSEGILIYEDTGDEATSHLIAYIDTATGLPVTPNGGNITITWDSGANKIFAL
jgi:hypothetical protein